MIPDNLNIKFEKPNSRFLVIHNSLKEDPNVDIPNPNEDHFLCSVQKTFPGIPGPQLSKVFIVSESQSWQVTEEKVRDIMDGHHELVKEHVKDDPTLRNTTFDEFEKYIDENFGMGKRGTLLGASLFLNS